MTRAKSFSSGFGLRPKMCRPSANTENSTRTREKPLVPRVMENGQSVFSLSPHTPVGRVRLARFTRIRLLRYALPISLLIWRKKPTVLQSTKTGAHNPERATYMHSCYGVFMDQFIFRPKNYIFCLLITFSFPL